MVFHGKVTLDKSIGAASAAVALFVALSSLSELSGAGPTLLFGSSTGAEKVPVISAPVTKASGEITTAPLNLECPSYLLKSADLPTETIRWYFPKMDIAAVRKLLSELHFPENIVEPLFKDQGRVSSSADGTSLFPKAEEVEQVALDVRSQLYIILGKSEENTWHAAPFVMPFEECRPWLELSRIPQKVRDVILKNSIKRGAAWVFCDLPLAVAACRTSDEKDQLFRLLTRMDGLRVSVHVPHQPPIQAMAEYWTAGFRSLAPIAVLESAAMNPGEDVIDIVDLLPPLPRSLLYTYPRIELAKYGTLPDCHWSSLNFFAEEGPNNAYLNTRKAIEALKRDYSRIEQATEFGDIILFQADDGAPLHSCVYLVNGLTFTKNGDNIVTPWTIQPVEALRRRYQFKLDGKIEYYRLKPIKKSILGSK